MKCSKVDKDSKIPRPLNSFMIFRLEKQREITQLCPGANHRDMSKIISKWWHELPAEEKQVYIDQAAKTKKEHIMKYPGYKYRPKRNPKPKRAYKKHPENELIARDSDSAQILLTLYNLGNSYNPFDQPSQRMSLPEDLPAEQAFSTVFDEKPSVPLKPEYMLKFQQELFSSYYLPMPLDMVQRVSTNPFASSGYPFQTVPSTIFTTPAYMPFNPYF